MNRMLCFWSGRAPLTHKLFQLNLFPQIVCWLCLLSLCLPLLLWFGNVIKSEDPSPAVESSGLRGYMRITPGSVEQVGGRAERHRSFVAPQNLISHKYLVFNWINCYSSVIDL